MSRLTPEVIKDTRPGMIYITALRQKIRDEIEELLFLDNVGSTLGPKLKKRLEDLKGIYITVNENITQTYTLLNELEIMFSWFGDEDYQSMLENDKNVDNG